MENQGCFCSNLFKKYRFDIFVYFLMSFFVVLFYFYNLKVFYLINGNHFPVINEIMFYFAQLGDGYVAVIVILLLFINHPKHCFAGIVSLLILLVLIALLKDYFHAPRPVKVLDDVQVIGAALKRRSFPSGHSATVFAVSRILWDLRKIKIKWIIFILTFIAALGRVYIGVHFPIDIAVGGLIGILVSEFSLFCFRKYVMNQNHKSYFVIRNIIWVLLVLGSIYSIFFYQIRGTDYWFFKFFGVFILVFISYQIYCSKIKVKEITV